MGIYAVVGVLLLVAFFLILRWFVNTEPRTVLRVLIWVGTIVFAAGTVFLLMTGRIGFVLYMLPALLPWLLRVRGIARAAKTFARMNQSRRGEATGGVSDLETATLRMRLNHDTGDLHGEVVAGRHANKALAHMSLADLLDLLDECRRYDPPSVAVVEAYLDRRHPGWRDEAGPEGGSAGAPSQGAAMTREEAFRVLGLKDDATAEEIKAAHRRLMAALHPDHGGSGYLAAKINQARDLLLGG